MYRKKCHNAKNKLYNDLGGELYNCDTLFIKHTDSDDAQLFLVCINKKENKEQEIVIPDNVLINFQENFCEKWNEFTIKAKIKTANNCVFCNNK